MIIVLPLVFPAASAGSMPTRRSSAAVHWLQGHDGPRVPPPPPPAGRTKQAADSAAPADDPASRQYDHAAPAMAATHMITPAIARAIPRCVITVTAPAGRGRRPATATSTGRTG